MKLMYSSQTDLALAAAETPTVFLVGAVQQP